MTSAAAVVERIAVGILAAFAGQLDIRCSGNSEPDQGLLNYLLQELY